jgi:Ca2+-binding EF-hand superfamily protein
MIGLQRSFKIMDDDDSKSLDIYEFTKAIKDYRVDVPESEIQILFNAFDVNRDGTLSYDEFLRSLRGPMNSFRKALVN